MPNETPAPRFPKPSILTGSALLFVLVIDILIVYQYLPNFGTTLGLSIDIVGAAILAVPDVPVLWRQTFSGRLNYAKESLKQTGEGGFSVLSRPGIHTPPKKNTTGFIELVEFLKPLLREDLSELMSGAYFIDDEADISEVDLLQITTITDTGLCKYNQEEESHTGYAGWSDVITPESAVFFIPETLVNQGIAREISNQKMRIRSTGLLLLILGFSQQILFDLVQVGSP